MHTTSVRCDHLKQTSQCLAVQTGIRRQTVSSILSYNGALRKHFEVTGSCKQDLTENSVRCELVCVCVCVRACLCARMCACIRFQVLNYTRVLHICLCFEIGLGSFHPHGAQVRGP